MRLSRHNQMRLVAYSRRHAYGWTRKFIAWKNNYTRARIREYVLKLKEEEK